MKVEKVFAGGQDAHDVVDILVVHREAAQACIQNGADDGIVIVPYPDAEHIRAVGHHVLGGKIVELKEVQLSMTIEQHDIDIKAKHATKFLLNGDKVKVSIRMSGRQQAYADRGVQTENDFAASLEEYATIEKPAKVEGRNIIMILAPKVAKK